MDGAMAWVQGYHSPLGSAPHFPGAQNRAIQSPIVLLPLVTCPLCLPYAGLGQRAGERGAGQSVDQEWGQLEHRLRSYSF